MDGGREVAFEGCLNLELGSGRGAKVGILAVEEVCRRSVSVM